MCTPPGVSKCQALETIEAMPPTNVPSLHPSASVFSGLYSALPFLALTFCSPTTQRVNRKESEVPRQLVLKNWWLLNLSSMGHWLETSQETLVVPWTSVFGGGIGYKLHVQLILWLSYIWKLLPSVPIVWTFLLGANIRTARIQDAGLVLADALRKFLFDLNVDDGLAALGYSKDDIPSLVKGTLPQVRFTVWPMPAKHRARGDQHPVC